MLSAVQVLGLFDFERALVAVPKEWNKVENEILRMIADEGARRSQAKARALGGVHAKASKAIKGRVHGGNAYIGVSSTKTVPMALVGSWGAIRRTGWNARNVSSSAQHPPWVGASWDVAVPGEGPYGINAALAEFLPNILDAFSDGFEDAASDAFPG